MTTVMFVSNYIIDRLHQEGKDVNNIRLQKILYYAQGYNLKVFGRRLFLNDVVQWQYGPSVPSAWFEYSVYGSSPIQVPSQNERPSGVTRVELELAMEVARACLDYGIGELIEKSKSEPPVQGLELRERVTVKAMKRYFATNDPLWLDTKIDHLLNPLWT